MNKKNIIVTREDLHKYASKYNKKDIKVKDIKSISLNDIRTAETVTFIDKDKSKIILKNRKDKQVYDN